jgi:hypothetical protein
MHLQVNDAQLLGATTVVVLYGGVDYSDDMYSITTAIITSTVRAVASESRG